MKERPIIMSSEMVKAILEGKKTQARRPIIGYDCPFGKVGDRLWVRETWTKGKYGEIDGNYGNGDGTCIYQCNDDNDIIYRADVDKFNVIEDELQPTKWKPSIHMPRWASRITLEITNISVERVQDIEYQDCYAEGIKQFTKDNLIKKYGLDDWIWSSINAKKNDLFMQKTPKLAYQYLWDSIYGGIYRKGNKSKMHDKEHYKSKDHYPWSSNPWVWIVEFKKVEK